MYMPYLRGKQYELIALRELAENQLIGVNILPIIEPTKLSPTLTKTLEYYIESGRDIAVIRNPKVGNFINEIEIVNHDENADKYFSLLRNQHVINCHITNNNSTYELRMMLEQGLRKEDIILIHDDRGFLEKYTDSFNDSYAKYNLMPDESAFRRMIRHNRILFNDRFLKKDRNTDYLNYQDEFFSDDHLFYEEDGYKGFSDYSVIGSDYSESGFAPYAVVIHIVYFDNKQNMKIRHFVSDSNSDFKDPAGKFGEALEKLIEWNKNVGLDTFGIRQFIQHHNYGTYPGLGTVKKLSIMHHIELMSNYLNGV